MQREIEPDLEIKWDTADAILLKAPGINRSWARWKTKDPAALECRFIGKPGQFNLSRFEGIGREPSLTQDRADGSEVLLLKFLKADHLKLGELKKVLAEHLIGFREIFGEE